jgi:O-antigen ligase
MILLPSATWTEGIEFSLAGTPLQVRFVLYALASAVLATAAVLSLLSDRRLPPAILVAGVAFAAWYLLTIVVAGQPLREWLPSMLRWTLYLSALVIGVRAGLEQIKPIGQFRAVFVGALLVPLLVGLVQLVTGSARILNNAPRISGSMLDHPVAFSLLLAAGFLALLPVALQQRSRRGVAVWLLLMALFFEILFTFTRATIIVTIGIGLFTALVSSRVMKLGRRVAWTAVVTAAVLAMISIPFIEARAGNEPPMSVELPGQPSGGNGQPVPTTEPVRLPFTLDNSTSLRVQTHAWGLAYIATSPVVGNGPGSFDRLFARDTGKLGVAAHDDFLLAAVETGIVGLLLLVLLYVAVTWRAFDGRRGQPFVQAHAIGMVAAFGVVNVLLAIHNPTYFPEVQLPLWLGTGVAIGAFCPDAPRHESSAVCAA